jgi:hypothetical protein
MQIENEKKIIIKRYKYPDSKFCIFFFKYFNLLAILIKKKKLKSLLAKQLFFIPKVNSNCTIQQQCKNVRNLIHLIEFENTN